VLLTHPTGFAPSFSLFLSAILSDHRCDVSQRVRAVAKHDAVGVRTQALIYSIFDELRDHVSSFLAPIIKHEPAGALEVAQV
jgi:hypothetical protein